MKAICLNIFLAVLTLQAMTQEKYPSVYYAIPQSVREQATVVFVATYTTGRGRNVITDDGVSKWYSEIRLAVNKNYTDNIQDSIICVEPLGIFHINGKELENGPSYLFLLKPAAQNMDILKGKYSGQLRIKPQEVLAIVKLSL